MLSPAQSWVVVGPASWGGAQLSSELGGGWAGQLGWCSAQLRVGWWLDRPAGVVLSSAQSWVVVGPASWGGAQPSSELGGGWTSQLGWCSAQLRVGWWLDQPAGVVLSPAQSWVGVGPASWGGAQLSSELGGGWTSQLAWCSAQLLHLAFSINLSFSQPL